MLLIPRLRRKKNLIVLPNGMNVYPEDVENALRKQAAVKDAVVLGLGPPDKVEVHAVLLLEAGTEARDIVRQANRELAEHQRVRSHTLWPDPDFPRTHTLKPRRAEILQRLGSRAQLSAPS